MTERKHLWIPPRAELPLGVTNYVTSAGYQSLLDERKALEKERKNRKGETETEMRRAAAVVDGKINLLNERISSARMVNLNEQPTDEVRFGARVELKNLQDHTVLIFQIVGVDEADVKKQKIAFVAPIVRAITGKKVGEVALLKLGAETRELEIIAVSYP